jgi:hypothetical protein
MLSDDMIPAMQGNFPSMVYTCSLDGEPNATVISQVYFVDSNHVALSRQFFNKTFRNVRENPQVSVALTCPETARRWTLELEFVREEKEGRIFDEMDMQIEAIASMTGMSGIFKLHSAEIYEVKKVTETV